MAYSPTTWVAGTTKLGPTNMNHLETGVANALDKTDMTTKGDLLVASAVGAYSRLGVGANNTVPVAASGQTTGIIWQQIGDAQVATNAAIAYSKLNLAGSVVNTDVAASAAIAVSKLAAGSNTQILTTTAGVPTWAAPAATNTVYTKLTNKTVVNTVTATDLLNAEITIAGGKMSASGLIHAIISGTYINNTAGGVNETFRVKLGGTTLYDSGLIGVTQATARRALYVEIWIQSNGATNSQRPALINFDISQLSGVATTGTGIPGGGNTGGPFSGLQGVASALDMTLAQALVFEWQHGTASASIDVQLDWARIEVV